MVFSIRISSDEYNYLSQMANKKGITIGAYIRNNIFKGEEFEKWQIGKNSSRG